MTQDTQREKFEACMRQASRHKAELLLWKKGRYEFDAMQSAFCGFCMGMEAALEAKQSEAKMPEPAAVVHAKLGTTCMIPGASIRKGDKLYTESQLRALLAQHGINIAD